MRSLLLALALIGLTGCADAAPVSGIYLSKSLNKVMMIQMVKTPDGHVQGRIEELILNTDGTLKDNDFALDGAIDGNQVTLKANELLGMGDTYIGTVDGTTLRLMMVNGQNTLIKSDMATFANAKAALQNKGSNIIAANKRANDQAQRKAEYDQAVAKRQSDFQNLQNAAQPFDSLPTQLSTAETDSATYLDKVKQQHDKIADDIAALKARWLVTPPNDRNSIQNDAYGQQNDMTALANEFRANETKLSGAYDLLRNAINDLKARCASAIQLNEPTVPQCDRADTYAAEYQSSRDKVRASWLNTEQMFKPANTR